MTLTDAYGNPRRPARFSQCSKLLHLLENGEWWSTRDLLREVPCIVHSRISELRKRGYTIVHETVGVGAAGSRYRLIESPVEEPHDEPPTARSWASPPPPVAVSSRLDHMEAPSSTGEQMELVA